MSLKKEVEERMRNYLAEEELVVKMKERRRRRSQETEEIAVECCRGRKEMEV